MRNRRKGFTLIELLVVIAIIGILAAMLFPVFAKARESARKIQCLSNVKNISMAVQLYLAEWDRGFPSESNMAVINYFNGAPGGGSARTLPDICNRVNQANPYIRAPVLLFDYYGSRDIWRCPSARISNGAAFIVPMGRDGFWMNAYVDSPTPWGQNGDYNFGPCYLAWPTGWGGEVTDSFTQNAMAATYGENAATGHGAKNFDQAIATSIWLIDLNFSKVSDPAMWVAVGDRGTQVELLSPDGCAYPDTCRIQPPGGCGSTPGCCSADWANCSWTQDCGLDFYKRDEFASDPSYRKTFTRHLGGENLGFLDGHAKWYPADAIINNSNEGTWSGGFCVCP